MIASFGLWDSNVSSLLSAQSSIWGRNPFSLCFSAIATASLLNLLLVAMISDRITGGSHMDKLAREAWMSLGPTDFDV